MLSHGYHSDAHSTLVRLHAGHEGPGVSLRVVHLHSGEVLHAIVAPDGPESVHVGDKSHPRSGHVHRLHIGPPEERPCEAI